MNRIASQIIEGLTEFRDTLKRDPKSIPTKFTCHNIVLDLEPTQYSPALVKQTRDKLNVSQTLFARFLGVAPSTVRAWEQGRNQPRDAACRLMDEIRYDPAYWRKRINTLLAAKAKR